MKIQKISETKTRVIFDYKELEENHISVHSFLSNSIQTQKLIDAIINIVNEELDFCSDIDEIKYDIISFCNKVFIIMLSKNLNVENNKNTNYIFLKFENKDEAYEVINNLKNYINNITEIPYNFYKLKQYYYIQLDINKLNSKDRKNFISILSEFYTPILLDSISSAYFYENASVIKEN